MGSGNIYQDYSVLDADFKEGLEWLRKKDFDKALDCFAKGDIHTPATDVYKNKYVSFHGLMLVYTGQSKGIDICRQAAAGEHFDGDVFHNLALAELTLNNRSAALAALQHGLRVDGTHPDLLLLRRMLGVRREPAVGFLGRGNLINKYLGKITYRLRH